MQQNENELLESLKCPICLDFAEEPVECECNNIFCKKCVTGNSKVSTCPICRRKNPNFRENPFVKKLIGNIPIACPNECGNNNISRGELKCHLNKCPNKKFSCNLCSLESTKEEFTKHIVNNHENELIKYFDKNSNFEEIKTNGGNSNTDIIPMINSAIIQMNNFNILPQNEVMKNKLGNTVTIGRTGKYYCGKKTNINCGCCDGNCGPDDGCNCAPCMEFSCKIMNLDRGILINNAGLPCKLYRCSFFCGREFVKETKNFLSTIFKKTLKCVYPNDACPDCQKITKNASAYLTKEMLNKLG